MALQPVNMRFDYGEAFEASRGTGYEVMIYSCMIGDATLFSRTDLVETAWRIAQPILDLWAGQPTGLPQLPGRILGPEGGLRPDGTRWPALGRDHQPRDAEEGAAVQRAGIFLHNLAMMLRPVVYAAATWAGCLHRL